MIDVKMTIRVRRATSALLMLGFLFQPLMFYLASPWFQTNNATDVTEVVCTLKGTSLQQLDSDSPMAQILAQDDYCPVMELVDMANSVLILDLPNYQPNTFYRIGLLEQTSDHQHHSLHYSAYSSRAPPVYS